MLLFSDGPFRLKLEKAGVRTEVVPGGRSIQEVTRFCGLASLLKAVPACTALARKVRRQTCGADIVYANSQKAFVVSALATFFSRGVLIWHLHDMLTADHFHPVLRKLAVLLANKRTSAVIANSRATAEAFRQCGGTAKTVVIYNGIAAPVLTDAERRSAERFLHGALHCPEGRTAGVFSRLAEWKGQHVAIEAARRVPGMHLLLVGGALFHDEKVYEASLRRQAADAGLADRVHFLGFRDDVPALMAAVDAVLHTSVTPEPFGRVIVEGMLAKKPVVATAAGGALEIVADGENGILVPPGDAEALAATLQHIFSVPTDVEQMAFRGYADACRRFSLPACLRAVDDIIDAVYPSHD